MKQTFTLYPSYSSFFATSNQLSEAKPHHGNSPVASSWVFKNLLAYSAALFVSKTKHSGSYSFLLN